MEKLLLIPLLLLPFLLSGCVSSQNNQGAFYNEVYSKLEEKNKEIERLKILKGEKCEEIYNIQETELTLNVLNDKDCSITQKVFGQNESYSLLNCLTKYNGEFVSIEVKSELIIKKITP